MPPISSGYNSQNTTRREAAGDPVSPAGGHLARAPLIASFPVDRTDALTARVSAFARIEVLPSLHQSWQEARDAVFYGPASVSALTVRTLIAAQWIDPDSVPALAGTPDVRGLKQLEQLITEKAHSSGGVTPEIRSLLLKRLDSIAGMAIPEVTTLSRSAFRHVAAVLNNCGEFSHDALLASVAVTPLILPDLLKYTKESASLFDGEQSLLLHASRLGSQIELRRNIFEYLCTTAIEWPEQPLTAETISIVAPAFIDLGREATRSEIARHVEARTPRALQSRDYQNAILPALFAGDVVSDVIAGTAVGLTYLGFGSLSGFYPATLSGATTAGLVTAGALLVIDSFMQLRHNLTKLQTVTKLRTGMMEVIEDLRKK